MKWAFILMGGALGTGSRYLVHGYVNRFFSDPSPWGTFAVNMLGSFLFGLVWVLTENISTWSTELRWLLLAGFMGAFTTFSTFMFDSSELIRLSQWGMLAGNMIGQTALGLAGLYLGITVGRIIA